MSVKDSIKDLPTGYHYRVSWNGTCFKVKVNFTKSGRGIVNIEDRDLDSAFIRAKHAFSVWYGHGVGGDQ